MIDRGMIITITIISFLVFLKCCDSMNQLQKMRHEYNMEELNLKYMQEEK